MRRPGTSPREVSLDLPQAVLPRIGGIATMPSRIHSLRQALPHILPQVQKLYVYLDQHDEVPQELVGVPKLVTLLPTRGSRQLGSAGRFWGLRLHREPCLYFCFDDDIVYKAGYVQFVADALRRHHNRCIAGIHGAVYRPPVTSYARDRTTLHFAIPLNYDVFVDELGCGTIGFHSKLMEIDPEGWEHPNQTDLHLMLEAVRHKVPRICVRRPAGLLQAIEENQPDSLYIKSLRDDSSETALLQRAMTLYPGCWSMS